MKNLITALMLILLSSSALAEAPSDQDRLKKLSEMRMRIERDEANANRRIGSHPLSPQAIDSPTVTQMQLQVQNSLARIENRFRCLDVKVKTEGGGITNIVCGANNGGISSVRTTAAGDIIKVGD